MADPRTDDVELVPMPRPRDSGATLVEMLVAIVLLGTVVVATLGALSTTIMGTRIERDHAKAHEWLQSAIHLVEQKDFIDCTTGAGVAVSAETVRQGYEDEIRFNTNAPYGWTRGQIAVKPIEVWDGGSWVPYAADNACYDDVDYSVQRVTVEVVGPSNDIIETVELVKSDV